MFTPMFHGQNRNTISGYGYLYNWHAINGNSTNLITGLRAPNDTEWTTLTTYLGGLSIAGGKLKETGTTHWNFPNTGATDEVNFTALPSGIRNFDGIFSSIGGYGRWWSIPDGEVRYLGYDYSNIGRNYYSKEYGFSIRSMRALTLGEQSTFADGEIVETKKDYDGNSYSVVRIGTQGWANTNLKTTHYLDGTALTKVTDNTAWAALTTEGYCAYDNDESNV